MAYERQQTVATEVQECVCDRVHPCVYCSQAVRAAAVSVTAINVQCEALIRLVQSGRISSKAPSVLTDIYEIITAGTGTGATCDPVTTTTTTCKK
eukprot:18820-Heterococcus_DN1.PRE.1